MNGHAPGEDAAVNVTCRASGPRTGYTDPGAQRHTDYDGSANRSTLDDLEAFCAELRRLGAPGDTPVTNAIDLRVLLTLPVP
jgi:hypothetical protein